MAHDKVNYDELALDDVFKQLEEVVHSMEEKDVSLEKSFDLYHEGMTLLKVCNDKIDKVEKQMLVLDDEGVKHEF